MVTGTPTGTGFSPNNQRHACVEEMVVDSVNGKPSCKRLPFVSLFVAVLCWIRSDGHLLISCLAWAVCFLWELVFGARRGSVFCGVRKSHISRTKSSQSRNFKEQSISEATNAPFAEQLIRIQVSNSRIGT